MPPPTWLESTRHNRISTNRLTCLSQGDENPWFDLLAWMPGSCREEKGKKRLLEPIGGGLKSQRRNRSGVIEESEWHPLIVLCVNSFSTLYLLYSIVNRSYWFWGEYFVRTAKKYSPQNRTLWRVRRKKKEINRFSSDWEWILSRALRIEKLLR